MPRAPRQRNFRVVLADPPWPTYGEARKHFPQMSIPDICSIPVSNWISKEAILLLWVPSWRIAWGLEVCEAWGFEYRTVGFCWVKTSVTGAVMSGVGFWTRQTVELCLLGAKGAPKKTTKPGARTANVEQLIFAPRREHARKPNEIYDRIEQLQNGPYLELFARQRRRNWTSWGNEIGKFKC